MTHLLNSAESLARLAKGLTLLIALAAVPASAQPAEQNQVPATQRDLVRDGLAVFRYDQGGPIPTPIYSAYRLRYLLEAQAPALYFTYRHATFTQTYRVMYLAEPTYAYRADGPIIMPMPPFFQAFRSDVYVMGVALGLPENSPTPSVTAWLPVAGLKLRTSP